VWRGFPDQVYLPKYVSRVKHPFSAIPDFDLHLAGESDDILDPGSVMPIAEATDGEPKVRHIRACL
jgi:hypothetical protein